MHALKSGLEAGRDSELVGESMATSGFERGEDLLAHPLD